MRYGVAINTRCNEWVETAALTDDDLDRVLSDEPIPVWVLLVIVATAAGALWLLGAL